MRNKYKAVIFDLDGTLVDDYGTIQEALNYVMSNLGLCQQTVESVKKGVGLGLEDMLARFVPEQKVEDAVLMYREKYSKIIGKHTRTLPFVEQTLQQLKQLDIKIAVASNKAGDFSRQIVKILSLHRYIDVVLCGDDIKSHKPDPKILFEIMNQLGVKKENTLYVGDMTVDVETGRNAGVETILVLTGSHRLDELKKAGAKYIHKNISYVLEYIRNGRL
jgi:2-phosphoglycolate phosphatase